MEEKAGNGEKVRNLINMPSTKTRSETRRGNEGEYTLLSLSLVCFMTLPLILSFGKSQPIVNHQQFEIAEVNLVSPILTDCECENLFITWESGIEGKHDSFTDRDIKERADIGCAMRKNKKVGEEDQTPGGRGHGGRGRGQTASPR